MWEAEDFHRLIPIGYYETNAIRDKHQRRGLGVPFVVERRNSLNRPMMRDRGAIPSTLVMRCDSTKTGDTTSGDTASGDTAHGDTAHGDTAHGEIGDPALGCRLELYDPLRVDSIEVDGRSLRIAKDTTSQLVYMLQNQQWSYLNYFINPTITSEDGRLYMLEPYQRDKVPLILIHGLLSDPFTWVQMINELLVHPGFIEHYQLWAFEYSTGNTFLQSATGLREQLASARRHYDPTRSDPQMSNMILVGHSMGGLVAKLQVTSSGDQLWNAVANRPLDELRVPDPIRERMRELLLFRTVT